MGKETFLMAVPPNRLGELRGLSVIPGHMAYRVGRGPHLFRSGETGTVRGGMMMLDGRGCDGVGSPGPFCQEVVRECAARNFSGVICDFEGQPNSLLTAILRGLEDGLSRRGWTLHVPEHYGRLVPGARVMISSALSGGSLELRLREAMERFGGGRVTLALQRTAEDFLLPAPGGSGTPLSREELRQKLERLRPSVFFSRELCARYFTYTTREGRPHFVLFDDPDTLRQKLEVARRLGLHTFLAAWPEVEDAAAALGLHREEQKSARSGKKP